MLMEKFPGTIYDFVSRPGRELRRGNFSPLQVKGKNGFAQMGRRNCRTKRSALIAAFGIPLIFLLGLWAKSLFSPLVYKLNAGERLFFDIEISSATQADFSVLFRDIDSAQKSQQPAAPILGQSFKLHIRAQITVSVLDKKDNRFLISYRFIDPSLDLQINGSDERSQTEMISRDLSREIFSDLDSQGRVLLVHFDPGMNRLSQSIARSLIAKIQFVLPEYRTRFGKKNHWETLEDDPNGKYKARYETIARVTDQNSPKRLPYSRAFRKTKQDYLAAEPKRRATQGAGQKTVIPGGSLEAFFNVRGGYLEWLGGSETERVLISNKKVSQSENSLRFRFLKKEEVLPLEISQIQRLFEERRAIAKPVHLSVELSAEEAKRIASRSTLGKATIETLLAELETSEKKGEKKNTPLYLKFRALINLHPEVSDTLAKSLLAAAPDSLRRLILSEALSTAGQPEAQEALVHVIRSCPHDSSFQNDLVLRLSMVDPPSVLAEDTLRDFAGDEKNRQICATSITGLGTMAYNLEECDPLRADKIVDWIMAQVHPPVPEAKLNLLLMSLGNSGSTRALPTLAKFLEHPSMTIRSTAVAGLRWIRDEKADELLVRVLRSDSESSVRNNAVFALSFRKPLQITLEAQKEALIEDRSALVRVSVLNNFWKMRQDIPELPMLLRQVAEKDPSEEVKKSATDMLARYAQESQSHPQPQSRLELKGRN